THCIVIDHGHVVESLGLPQSDFGWTLEPERNVNTETLKANSRPQTEETARTCAQCAAMWLTSEDGNSCPSCGWTPEPKSKPIDVLEADLAELADEPGEASPYDPDVIEFYRQAVDWYGWRWPQRWREKPKSGRWWAWNQTREKFHIDITVKMPGA